MSKVRIFQTINRTISVKPGQIYAGMSVEASQEARRLEQRKIIGERIKTLKNLTYDTLAGQYVPQGRAKCLDIYKDGLEKIRDLGRKGGADYDHLLTALKYTWDSKENFQEVEMILTGRNL
jgi:hypothetical protein